MTARVRAEDLAVAAPAGALWRVRVVDATDRPPSWSEEQLTAGTWGSVSPDPMRDLAKLAVVDPATGAVARAFLRGLGLQAGALAASVEGGRVVVAGSSDAECAAAANALLERGARAVVTVGARVLATDPPAEDGTRLEDVARDLGSEAEDPVDLVLAAAASLRAREDGDPA